LDDDLETRGYLRLSPKQPWRRRFRYQHLFFVCLYGLNTLEWIFVKDFVQFFTQRMNPYQRLQPMSRRLKQEFLISKLIYIAVFVLLPFVMLPPLRVVAGLILFHVTLSLSMSFVFGLAHVIEKADFPVATADRAKVDEWAAHQMRTTANFATDNRLLNWFAGGLNFQIEHHLFPHISHTHYPDISGIVRQAACEFGLPYNHYGTFREALQSHYRTLYELGAGQANAT
jgi:linoleoyl-CoA desaturase